MRLAWFSFFKVPLIFSCCPRIVSFDDNRIELKIPLRRRTKNHLNSMYFGALSVGADVTGGFFAMQLIEQSGHKVHLSFKHFHADFLKRAEGDTHFVCLDGPDIQALVTEVLTEKVRKTRDITVMAYVPTKLGDEPVAKFTLGLSLKGL